MSKFETEIFRTLLDQNMSYCKPTDIVTNQLCYNDVYILVEVSIWITTVPLRIGMYDDFQPLPQWQKVADRNK